MTTLSDLLTQFRQLTQSERDKGTAFERLIIAYFEYEPYYQSLYSKVQTYGQWAAEQQFPKVDTGIDLVATTHTGEFHAIQCKNFAEEHSIQKSDIDSFFTASGKSYFTYRIIVATTNKWSKNASESLKIRLSLLL